MSTTIVPQKQCRHCGNVYPSTTEYFYKDRKGKHGVGSICKQCALHKSKEWYANNLQHAKATRSKYRATHKAERQLYVKLHANNFKVYNRDSYKRHSYKRMEHAKLWQQSNPEKRRITYTLALHRRRARKHAAPGSHTSTDIDILYINQRGKCAYCGCDLNGKYHVDHIVPLSRGGTDYAENLALACPHCNMSKNNKLLSEWKP